MVGTRHSHVAVTMAATCEALISLRILMELPVVLLYECLLLLYSLIHLSRLVLKRNSLKGFIFPLPFIGWLTDENSKCIQEIPQSHTADQPTVP